MQANRTFLLRWCGCFFLGNAILFWLIGLGYFKSIPWLDCGYLTAHAKWIIKIFVASVYIGHLGLLALLPFLVFIPLILIWPQRLCIFILSIMLATALATLLAIDVLTYQLYRFHLNKFLFNFVLHQEVIGLAQIEIGTAIVGISLLLIFEIIYGLWLWRVFLKRTKTPLKWFLFAIFFSLFFSYEFLIYSYGYFMNRILVDVASFLPGYTYVFGSLLPIQNSFRSIEKLNETYLFQPSQVNFPLNYQVQETEKQLTKQYNLLIIVIDTWRFDMLNSQATPNLLEFANKSWVFKHHYSGGNSTGPGIFSLFYSIPFSYWTAVYMQNRGPLLIDELLKHHYQMGIFGSATLKLPAFNQTVFVAVKNLLLDTPGKSPYDRDRAITQEFKNFINKTEQTHQSFFSFLFYDSAHTYCSFDEDLQPLQPVVKNCNRLELTNDSDPIPYFNRYKNALLLVDQQIKQVLDTLETHHLLNKTIVVVTGDHGEEFNDNHLGYWGHASNFTHYQIQTPLIVHWPGTQPKTFQHLTSHYDIAPTLMKYLLEVQFSPKEYSLGTTLLDSTPRPYLIVNSYNSWGVIESNHIIDISPVGFCRIEQWNGQLIPQPSVDLHTVELALHDLRRFYR